MSYFSLGKTEDLAHSSGDVGVQMLGVRKATPVNLSNADGDYEPFQISAGRIWTSTLLDTAIPAGTNNIGDVDILTVPADPFGVNADAASATGSISAKLRFIAATGIPITGTVTVTAAGDIAHDAGDSGNPVKVGAKGANALPTAVANNDRTHNISDLWGRVLTSHIDPGMQVAITKTAFNATTTQTGAAMWTPASGKRIAITSLVIGTYGTTAARVIIWIGASGDTTYTAGTDHAVVIASFAPSATVKPGLVFTPAIPVFSATADHILKITTDAGISIDVTWNGYEF